MGRKRTGKTKKYLREYSNRGLRKDCKIIMCKCPKCEINHEVAIYWTGRGIPRIFCKECMNNNHYKFDTPNENHVVSRSRNTSGKHAYKESIESAKLL